ncbi:unnamed protein product [Heterotrigona itama]|uniref:Uncharacterized protein n=1 Tax=Heterotrigona itama TaxID=395501 RepID=A0A6V7H1Q8_9HYME|nr:unnamed protein product [Heterotrigona itama]
MQLPGGSTRNPPARAPASVLVIINGSNILSTITKKRNGNGRSSNENDGPGTNSSDSVLRKSRNSLENEPRLLERNRRPETRIPSSRRHRVTEKPQLLASAPRRKERGEE